MLNTIPHMPAHQPSFLREEDAEFVVDQVDTPEEESEEIHENILEILSPVPIAVDEVIRACHLSTSVVLTALLELELADHVQRHAGNRVSRIERINDGSIKQYG